MSIDIVVFSGNINGGVISWVLCSRTSENNSWSITGSPLATNGSPKLESKLAQPVSNLGVGSVTFSPQGLEEKALETKYPKFVFKS